MPLSIVYRDTDFIVVDKPPGLLVHRTELDGHAREFALQILRDQLGHEVHPCHRLDRATSGLLLFARHSEALKWAREQFSEQRIGKEYLAIVRGWMPERGIIDHPLRPFYSKNKPAQPARTRYERLATSELDKPVDRYPTARFSLVRLEPLSGRTHQLRRHCKHLSHPILGDTRHGDGRQNRFMSDLLGVRRLLLRATRMELPRPAASGPLVITAPEDAEFERIRSGLGLPPIPPEVPA